MRPYHEATPQVLQSRCVTPGWCTQRRKHVTNATSQGTGRSMQTPIRSASIRPAKTEGTLASRVGRTTTGGLPTVTGQTQLIRQRSTTIKPSKASHHNIRGKSTYKEGDRRTTERGNELGKRPAMARNPHAVTATQQAAAD